jgi:uncharacterized protein
VTILIDVRDLLATPGSSRPVHVSELVPDVATELAVVPQDKPIEAHLLLESLLEGLLAIGNVRGGMVLSCARCLRPSAAPFDLAVNELFVAGATDADDEYPLTEDNIDLEPMLRDAVVLSMPFAPLCRPDCLGLCERCGGDRNIGECTCPPAEDPRWAPLLGLTLNEE